MVSFYNQVMDRLEKVASKVFFQIVDIFKWLLSISNSYINSLLYVDTETSENGNFFEIGKDTQTSRNIEHSDLIIMRDDVENGYIFLNSSDNS